MPAKGFYLDLCVLFLVVISHQAYSEKCYDLPGQLEFITSMRENTEAGEVAFQFRMNMAGISLSLEPTPGSEGYLRLDIGPIFNTIYINKTLTINSLNPDLVDPPPPDTDEDIDCSGSTLRDIRLQNVVNRVGYRIVCQYPDFQPTTQDVWVFVDPEVNDFAPVFLCAPYSKRISEFTPVGSTVFRAGGLAWDPDVEGEIDRFGLVDNQDEHFSMPRYYEGGIILEKALDYETSSSFQLNITVSDYSADPLTPSRKNWTNIFLEIIDEDDQNPIFMDRWHYLEIQEEDSSIIDVGLETMPRIFAYDQDTGRNDPVAYEITAGHVIDGVTYFDIEPTTGLIKSLVALDRETISNFMLEIKAYQLNNPIKRTAFAFVDVRVLDINDNPPVMDQDTYRLVIPEHSPENMHIITVTASDQDQGDNGLFEFLLADAMGAFTINALSGTISVIRPDLLDRETIPRLVINVTAKEILTGERFESLPSRIEIELVDINDNNPIFSESDGYTFYTQTNTLKDSNIGRVAASDSDDSLNGDVNYFISSGLSGGDWGMFFVNQLTGDIYPSVDITRAEGAVVSLALVAQDRASIVSNRRTSVTRVNIVFTDGTVPTKPSTLSATFSITFPRASSPSTPSGTSIHLSSSNAPCICPSPPSTEDNLYPANTFWPVVAMLIFAILLLIGILILLVLLRRYTAPRKVDRGTEAVPEDDKASLIANEQLRRSINKIFRQLEGESSTEQVLRSSINADLDSIAMKEKTGNPPLLQWPVHDLSPLVSDPNSSSASEVTEVLTQTANNVPYGRLDEGTFLNTSLDNLSVSINVDTAEPMYTLSTSKTNKITAFPTQLPYSQGTVAALSGGVVSTGPVGEGNNSLEDVGSDSSSESEQDFSGWKSEEETSLSAETIKIATGQDQARSGETVVELDQLSGVLLLDSVLEEEEKRCDMDSLHGSSSLGLVTVLDHEVVKRSSGGGDLDSEQVHVVGELPRPFKKEDEDNYVDHTFYTRIGPVTIL